MPGTRKEEIARILPTLNEIGKLLKLNNEYEEYKEEEHMLSYTEKCIFDIIKYMNQTCKTHNSHNSHNSN